jgi:hypothetical protein
VADYDRAIPPGGVGKITLQVKTKGFQGRITKSASVYSNDPNQRTTKIYMSINVRSHIIIEPAPRIFLSGIAGEKLRRVVHIRAADDQPLEITGVTTNLDSVIEYELNRREDGGQYELVVASKSSASQVSSGFLQLSTNHPVKKELKLPILVRILPELETRPRMLTFIRRSREDDRGKQFKRVFSIVNKRGNPFRVLGLQYNKEYFEVRPLGATDEPASNHQFEVVLLTERLPAGGTGLTDILIIRTDLAQAAELKVPLRIHTGRVK